MLHKTAIEGPYRQLLSEGGRGAAAEDQTTLNTDQLPPHSAQHETGNMYICTKLQFC